MRPAHARATALVLVSLLSVGAASARPDVDQAVEVTTPSAPAPPNATTHHEVVTDTYRPTPPSLRRTAPPARPMRNGFLSVQVNVDAQGQNILGDAANEPSIAIDPNDPSRAAIGWREFNSVESSFRQAGWGYTQDSGASWTFPGVIEPGIFRSDPVLDFDAEGNFYYNSLGVEGGVFCTVFISSDGGQSWGPGVFAWGGDKQWMAIDRTDGIGRGNIYANWSVFASNCTDQQFTRSYDEGESYLPCIEVPAQPRWGTLTVGPDGRVYIPSALGDVTRSSTLQDPELPPAFDLVSFADLGGSLHPFLGPNPDGLTGQMWIASDHSTGDTAGNIYVLASVDRGGDDPLDVMFTRSEDRGETWSPPVKVNDDAAHPGAWQWFGTMSVAPNGRINAIWNDTRNSLLDFYVCEMFYASSVDGGRTWSKNIAVTPSFNSRLGWPIQRKIGDYYDMISDDDGANVAFAATFNGEQDVYFLRVGDALCPADVDDDDAVGFGDVLRILAAWGPCNACAEDIDDDGVVGFADVLAVLAAWGPCTIGACCLPDATCVEDAVEACDAIGGRYQGNASTCEAPCRGACCRGDGSCDENASEGACLAAGGIFAGNGSTCVADCQTGPCCLTDTCIEVNEAVCLAIGGAPGFPGGTCEGGRCDFSTDECADAVILDNGTYFFRTTDASESGPDLPPECDEGAGLDFVRDVWFRYRSPVYGIATASLCNSDFDSRIAIYEDGACPGAFVTCNDDACGSQARVLFLVEEGAVYLIRIGSSAEELVGTGRLQLTSTP